MQDFGIKLTLHLTYPVILAIDLDLILAGHPVQLILKDLDLLGARGVRRLRLFWRWLVLLRLCLFNRLSRFLLYLD